MKELRKRLPAPRRRLRGRNTRTMAAATWLSGKRGLRRVNGAAPPTPPADAPAAARSRAGLRLSLLLSERRFLLAALDVIALNGSLLLTLAIRSGYRMDVSLLFQHLYWFIALSALWLPIAAAFDVYDARSLGRLSTGGLTVAKAGFLVSVVYLLIPYVTPPLPGSRMGLLTFPALVILTTVGVRVLFTVVMTQPPFLRRALIVGTNPAGHTIAGAVMEWGTHAFHLLGFVGSAKQRMTTSLGAPRVSNGKSRSGHLTLPVLGSWKALPDLVVRHQATTLILAVTGEIEGELLQNLMDCLELGVEIIPMPVLYEQLTGCVPVQYIGQNWYVAMPLDHPGTRGLYPPAKRGIDIALASLGLLVLGVLFPFIALAIYLDSPGPLFYAQVRVGKGGRRFTAYKFRSMVPDAEHDRALWAERKDPRVTRVGRLLRRTHLDEFPQVWNVLRGEMSAVGPRPERPEFIETLSREIPFYRVRHAVRPGMAGWGLVRQGYAASKKDALVKLQYDLYYIKHQSLWLDGVILLKTILDTLTFHGR